MLPPGVGEDWDAKSRCDLSKLVAAAAAARPQRTGAASGPQIASLSHLKNVCIFGYN